jgi:hypothetical protein
MIRPGSSVASELGEGTHERSTSHPGEGLFRASEAHAPKAVLDARKSVVRVSTKVRFRLTVFETGEEAAAARKRPRAREKEFMPEGGVIWPVLLDRLTVREICTSKQSLKPGYLELCEVAPAPGTPLSTTMLTSFIHASASGFIVGRLPNRDYIVATAYHVAREAIERTHRTEGVHKFSPQPTDDLIVSVSKDTWHESREYVNASGVRLLANASKPEWQNGEDWALLAISSHDLPELPALSVANEVPLAEDLVWAIGFPSRTARDLSPNAGYVNASDDLRISAGKIVGDAAARKLSKPSDLISTVDGVAGSSGSVIVNSRGEAVGLFRDHTGDQNEADLRIERYQGFAQIVPIQFFGSLISEKEHPR